MQYLKIIKISLLSGILFLIPLASSAQNNSTPPLERTITLSINNQPAEKIIAVISEQTGIIFSYNPQIINNRSKTSIHIRQKTVRYALNFIFNGSIKYKTKGKYIILQKNNPTSRETNSRPKTQIIEGYITETKSGQKLADVTIYDKNHLASAITNQYGYFKMELPAAQANTSLYISKQGYTDTLLRPIKENENNVDIELSSKEKDTLRTNISDHDFTKHSRFLSWLVSPKIRINTRNLTDTLFRKIQISFLPFISTNRLLTGSTANNLSLNIIAGYVQEVRSFEMGGYLNIVRHDAGKCQLAGIGNIVGGTSRGFQASGIFNYAHEVRGIQASGIFNSSLTDVSQGQLGGTVNITGGAVNGFQVAGIVNYAKTINGVQLAGTLNVVLKDNKNFQIAGIGNMVGGTSYGIQGAGIINIAHHLKGTQAAGILNMAADSQVDSSAQKVSILPAHLSKIKTDTTKTDQLTTKDTSMQPLKGVSQIAGIGNIFGGTIHGAQVASVFNIAQTVKGVQVAGMLNIAANVKGTQIALLNFSDSCQGTPIGFFSFVKKGYHWLEVSFDETFCNASFRTGTKGFHNIFMISASPKGERNPLWATGYGLGTTLGNPTKKTLFDIDFTSQHLYKGSSINSVNTLYKLYAGIDHKIGLKASIALGLTLNSFMAHTSDPDYQSLSAVVPYSLISTSIKDDLTMKAWIGGKIALRFW